MLSESYGQRPITRLIKRGVIGDGCLIDVTPEEIEAEKIHCTVQHKVMTRAQCLDYSGDKKNFENCKGCETGTVCKDLLLDPPLHTA